MGISKRTRAGGFTLLELLVVVVILGLLAAVAVPAVGQSTRRARESALAENLREVRAAVARYQVEHRGVRPGYPDGDTTADPTEKVFREQLTKSTWESGALVGGSGPVPIEKEPPVVDPKNTTSEGGEVGSKKPGSRAGSCGPYLAKIPDNPFNGKNRIRIVRGAATEVTSLESREPTYGWSYDPETGRFSSAVDGKTEDGTAYGKM